MRLSIKPPLRDHKITGITKLWFFPQNNTSKQQVHSTMSTNTPPKPASIEFKRRRSPTDASTERPASHKKAKKPIADTKKELFGTTKSPFSSKKTTKSSQQSKRSSNHMTFQFPYAKLVLNTNVLRPNVATSLVVPNNFISNTTKRIKNHFQLENKKKITKPSRLRCQSPPMPSSLTSITIPSSAIKATTTTTDTTTLSSVILHNHQRCFLEDFMSLQVDMSCIVLVPKLNTLYVHQYSRLIDSMLESSMIHFGDEVVYHVCNCIIKSNNDYEKLKNNGFSKLDMQGALVENQNNGVFVVASNDDEDETLITWKDVLNGRDTGIQVWKVKDEYRDLYPTFIGNRKNTDRLESIFFNIVKEIYYDSGQMTVALNAYYRAVNAGKDIKVKELQSSLLSLEERMNLLCEGSIYDELLSDIDNIFKNELLLCFRDFTAISEPIVNDTTIVSLIYRYKQSLPSHYNMMLQMLHYHKKIGIKDNNHLIDDKISYYDRMVFIQFLVQARIRNSHRLVHWACVITASNYSKKIISNTTNNLGSFFGYSVSYTTFFRMFKEWQDGLRVHINNTCNKETIVWGCIDNNQQTYGKTYQTNGKASTTYKCTASVLKKGLIDDDDIAYLHESTNVQVPLTYINQVVPSPLKMYHFENIQSFPDIFNCINNLPTSVHDFNIDTTGQRVLSYYNIASKCFILHMLKQQFSRFHVGNNVAKYCHHTGQCNQDDEMYVRRKHTVR